MHPLLIKTAQKACSDFRKHASCIKDTLFKFIVTFVNELMFIKWYIKERNLESLQAVDR